VDNIHLGKPSKRGAMSSEKFIEHLEKALPDVCTSKDLITQGLFASDFEAVTRRKNKLPPNHIPFSSRRIVYLKDDVISWVRDMAERGKCRQIE
jgi:hypothetical protein